MLDDWNHSLVRWNLYHSSDWLNSKGYEYHKVGCFFMNQEMNKTDLSYHTGWAIIEFYGYLRNLLDAAGIVTFQGINGQKTLVDDHKWTSMLLSQYRPMA